MRLLALFMLLGFCSVHAASHGQEAVVDLRMSGATLSEVFQQIERQTDYMFVYKIEDVRAVDRVDVNVSHAMVKDVLASCLQGTGLVYVFRDNVIVIQRTDDEKPEVEKALTVKGWVQDEKKLPMPGVTVRVVGTSVGTATNEKGWFSIDLPIRKGKLEFSFVTAVTAPVKLSFGLLKIPVTTTSSMSTASSSIVMRRVSVFSVKSTCCFL